MSPRIIATACCTLSVCLLSILPLTPAAAADLDSLKGHFAFNWHSEPAKTACVAVDDQLLATFKSDAYACDLTVITNTASGEPARICSEKSEGAEYMIFETQKSCDSEREVQASNSEEE